MSQEWYSAYLEARAPAGADPVVDECAADALMDLLEKYDGVVSASDGSWGGTISIDAPSASDAAFIAGGIIEERAGKAGMPVWPVVRVEVTRQDLLDTLNEQPTLPELVSVPEAAEILGVSPQRVHELAATNATFPGPVYELRTGKLWLRAAVEAFSQRWERKPGRPRKAVAG